MNTEHKFRTLSELIDSATLDIRGIDWENHVEPAELIKVAERINAEFSLKKLMGRDRCFPVEHGRAKLPAGFSSVSEAWFADEINSIKQINPKTQTYIEYLIDSLAKAREVVNSVYSGVRKTEMEILTIDLPRGINVIKHTLASEEIQLQAKTSDGEVLLFDFTTPNNCDIVIDNQANQDFTGVELTVVAAEVYSDVKSLNAQIEAESIKVSSRVSEKEYVNVCKVEMIPPVHFGPRHDSLTQNGRVAAYLKNGWIYFPGKNEGLVRLTYVSEMENEEGEYITLDHPLVNDYYEYAIKERIFENLLLAGHSQYSQRYDLMRQKKAENKLVANGYVNTPGYREMKRAHRKNRAKSYHKYYRNQR